LRLRLDLAVVILTLAGGTTVGEGRAALFSCQVGQWKGEVTAGYHADTDEKKRDRFRRGLSTKLRDCGHFDLAD
jgi:hypothetical protein